MTIYYAGPKKGQHVYTFFSIKSARKYTPKNWEIEIIEF